MALKIIRTEPTTDLGGLRVLGLDPSLTATGWAALDKSGMRHGSGVFKAGPKLKGWNRLMWQMDELASVIDQYTPEIAVIEGYAMTGTYNSGLIEIGALLRWSCLRLGLPFVEVSPGQIKKYATGKGNAQKDQVMLAVWKQWGFDPPDNNVADAYAAAQIGRGVLWPETTKMSPMQKELAQAVATSLPEMQSIALNLAS